MSQVDLTAALRRIVAQMRVAGYSVPEIISLIIGDTTPKVAAPAIASPKQPRMIAVEHANGTTRLVPWSPEFQAQLDREVKAKAQPTPAPKPVETTPNELDVDLDALIAEQEADLAKLRAMRGSK